MAEEGKRRQSWRENAEPEPKPAAEPEAAKPAAPRASTMSFQTMSPKRFRGGKVSVDRHSAKHPAWLRIFLPGTAFFLTIVTLIAVALWILPAVGAKPLLVAWAVTDYPQPIPPNDFALNDVRTMQRSDKFSKGAGGEWQDTTNMQTLADFELFFEKSLKSIEGGQDAVVVYLSAHGVSDRAGSYLLHAQSTQEPSSGYPLGNVLRRMAECNVPNKLLILDATRIAANLDLGLLGNDFVFHLKREFDLVKRDLEKSETRKDHSFWVLCSSDEGQIAWASPSLKHSVFGLTASYCLWGGPDADRSKDGQTDDMIDAREFVDYVVERVSSWAPRHRNAVQKPLVLEYGDEFPLVPVAHDLASNWWEPPPPPEPEPEAKKEESTEKKEPEPKEPERKIAKPANKVDEALVKIEAGGFYGNTTFTKDNKPMTPESLADRLNQFWQLREGMAQDRNTIRRPDQWHQLQQKLLHAERLLLAGEIEDSQAIVENPVPPLLNALAVPSNWPAPTPWSLAFLDPNAPNQALVDQQAAIDSCLANPVDAALEKIANSTLVEADLLRILAGTVRAGSKWKDSDAVDYAVRARTNAERPTLLPIPNLLPFIERIVEQGDRHRRTAEVALILERFDEAKSGFTRANQEYNRALAESQKLTTQYFSIQNMVMNIPYVLRWLGADPPNGVDRQANVERLAEFLKSLKSYLADPSAEELELLSTRGDRLQAQAEFYAENALQRENAWREIYAALELPFLKASLRKQLIQRLQSSKDGLPFTKDPRENAASPFDSPANPYPLADFFALFEASAEVEQFLTRNRLDGAQSGGLTVSQLTDEKNRELRFEACERVREVLKRFRNQPKNQPQGSNEWESEIRHRLLSAFHIEEGIQVSADDFVLRTLYERSLIHQLDWQINSRFAVDRDSLPQEYFYVGRIIPELTRYVQRQLDDASFRVSQRPSPFALEGDSKVIVEGDGPKPAALLVRTRQRYAEGEATLVLNWDPTQLDITVAGAEKSAGQLRKSLGPLETDRPEEVKLTYQRRGLGDARIRSRIELADRSIHWLPIEVHLKPPKVKPAELHVGWIGQKGPSDRLELYPQQSFSIQIEVRKQVEQALSMQLRLDGGTGTPSFIDIKAGEKEMGKLPLPVPMPIDVPIQGGTLLCQLFNGSEKLDEKRLNVDVLDPSEFLAPVVEYDEKTRFVTVKVSRKGETNLEQRIPLSLEVTDIQVQQGTTADDIGPREMEKVLNAQLPPGASDDDFGITLSACGVPRAFRFSCTNRRPDGVPNDSLTLEIVNPRDRSKYNFKSIPERLPVTVQADGPAVDSLTLAIGVDANGDKRLEDVEIGADGEFHLGRDVQTVLHLTDKGAKIDSKVGDITLPIRAGARGRQTIIARLASGSKIITSSIEVYFLTEAPRMEITAPLRDTEVTVGSPIEVALQGDPGFYGAIDNIVFAFDKNNDGAIAQDEIVIPLNVAPNTDVRFGDERNLKVRLPSDKLPPGRAFLLAEPQTRVLDFGKPGPATPMPGSLVRQQVLQIIAPVVEKPAPTPTPTPAKETPKFGRIEGVVMHGPSGKKGAKVAIAGIGECEAGVGGKFTFEDVPPGEYQITAKAPMRAGQKAATVKAGETTKVEIPIALQ